MLKFVFLSFLVSVLATTADGHWGGLFGRTNFGHNLACRLMRMKTVVENGRATNCVSKCGQNYEDDYNWKYGHVCRRLPFGCASRNCRRCMDGFYSLKDGYRFECVEHCPIDREQREGKCLEIPRGCVSHACTACTHGYFYNPRPLYSRMRCKSYCPTGYVKNTATNTCDQRKAKPGCVNLLCYRCKSGYYKFMDQYRHTCVTKCPSGMGPMSGRCRDIPRGCLTAECSKCDAGYFHYRKAIFFQKCRRECPIGYFGDSDKRTCIACEDERCSKCDIDPDYCEKCRSPFALLIKETGNETSSLCVFECPVGYRKIYDYETRNRHCDKIERVITSAPKPVLTTILPPPQPATFPEGCADDFCATCKAGFYTLAFHGSESKCVEKCPSGYFTGSRDCFACAEPRCDVCSKSPFQCEICKPSYISLSSSGNKTVRCLDECPKGFVKISQNGTKVCEKKPTPGCNINNCDQCAGHELHKLHIGCVECQAGYLLKRNIFKDECVAVCPDGFYPGVKPGTKISACLDCQAQFCQSCLRQGKCSECFEPFVISFKTGKCTLCKPGTFYNRRSRSCKTLSVVPVPAKKPAKKKTKLTFEDLLSAKEGKTSLDGIEIN